MKLIVSILIFSLLFLSCKKQAGPGGTSSIRGKVYAEYYDKKMTVLTDSSYAPDIDVYIIYGNDFSYGDHQKTSYNGSYEFKYLENGSYLIYTYSRDSTGFYKYAVNQYAPDVAITQKVDISKRKQTIELPDIRIIK